MEPAFPAALTEDEPESSTINDTTMNANPLQERDMGISPTTRRARTPAPAVLRCAATERDREGPCPSGGPVPSTAGALGRSARMRRLPPLATGIAAGDD